MTRSDFWSQAAGESGTGLSRVSPWSHKAGAILGALTSRGPPFKQERIRKTRVKGQSFNFHESDFNIFFKIIFKRNIGKDGQTSYLLRRQRTRVRGAQMAKLRRKSQRVRCLSPNRNCVLFSKLTL